MSRLVVLVGLAMAVALLLISRPEPVLADGFTQATVFTDAASMRLDASGNPVIAYLQAATKPGQLPHLGIIVCNDPNCEGADESVSQPTSGIAGVSLVLDAAGNPVVSYLGGSELKLLHCDDAACTGGGESVAIVSSIDGMPFQTNYGDSSLVLDVDGNPVISIDGYLVHCNDPNCDGGDESVGFGTLYGGSLVLDATGNPVFAAGGFAFRVIHCNDPNCIGDDESVSIADPTSFDSTFEQATSISLDAAGNPVVAYTLRDFDTDEVQLKVLHCNDPNCVGDDESITVQGFVYERGIRQQMVLDVNGYPVIAYLASGTELNVQHCNDANCAGGDESIVTVTLGYFLPSARSLQLDAAGNPVVAHAVGGVRTMNVLHCNDVNCAGGDESTEYPAVPAGPVPPDGPEMALNVSGGVCDDPTRPTTCDVPVGASFALSVDVLTRPVAGYIGMQTFVDFGENLIYQPTASALDEIAWPLCEPAVALRSQFDGTNGPPPFLTNSKVNHACITALLPPLPVSTFEGTVVSLSFDCSEEASSTVVTLLPQHTPVTGGGGALFVTGPIESVIPTTSKLAINCVAPAPVGGITLDSGLRALPLETADSSSAPWRVAIAIAAVASLVAVASVSWYGRRRLLK